MRRELALTFMRAPSASSRPGNRGLLAARAVAAFGSPACPSCGIPGRHLGARGRTAGAMAGGVPLAPGGPTGVMRQLSWRPVSECRGDYSYYPDIDKD
jgi:hypothetical protein